MTESTKAVLARFDETAAYDSERHFRRIVVKLLWWIVLVLESRGKNGHD